MQPLDRQTQRLAIFCTLVLVLLSVDITQAQEREALSTTLPPGIEAFRYQWHKEICMIYVAEAERRTPKLHIGFEVATGKVAGLETVRNTAVRLERPGHKTIVATNGGFGILWNTQKYGGAMDGLHIQQGELVSRPQGASFGITNKGEFIIDDIGMEANIEVNGQRYSITGLNERCMKSCPVILYTPRFGESTHTSRRTLELVLAGMPLPIRASYDGVSSLHHSKQGDTPIPVDGVVISVWHSVKDAFEQLPEGAEVQLSIRFSSPGWDKVVEGIGGDERLLQNGQICARIEELEEAQSHRPGRRGGSRQTSHEPRTALGFNDETFFLVVADGRQPGYSTGLSLRDLAEVFLELGATHALNLDGGGSSTFVLLGDVVNRPAGKEERPILNSVLIWTETEH